MGGVVGTVRVGAAGVRCAELAGAASRTCCTGGVARVDDTDAVKADRLVGLIMQATLAVPP